ncbi:MAG: hypothetical protein F6K56_03105 [Moorea sp. SIO3G5]|nr:hypothetical protein [Moorena sp. SIO3G5]
MVFTPVQSPARTAKGYIAILEDVRPFIWMDNNGKKTCVRVSPSKLVKEVDALGANDSASLELVWKSVSEDKRPILMKGNVSLVDNFKTRLGALLEAFGYQQPETVKSTELVDPEEALVIAENAFSDDSEDLINIAQVSEVKETNQTSLSGVQAKEVYDYLIKRKGSVFFTGKITEGWDSFSPDIQSLELHKLVGGDD